MPHELPPGELQELAQALYRRKEYTAALDNFTKAINASKLPSASLLDNRSAAYEKLEDLHSALRDARTTIRAYGDDVTGYLRAGKLLQKMNNPDVALEIYKRGIAKKPRKIELLRQMHDKLSRSLAPTTAATTAVDPFTQLPIEIVEQILTYLDFRQMVGCTSVSKQWNDFITSLPTLWQHMDLSRARRPIRNTLVSQCINRARKQIVSAQFKSRKVIDLNAAISTLVTQCHSLQSLQFHGGGPYIKEFVDRLALATRLSSLTLSGSSGIGLGSVTQILALCPSLKSVQCSCVMSARHQVVWGGDLSSLEELELVSRQVPLADSFALPELASKAVNLRSMVLRNWTFSGVIDLQPMNLLTNLDLKSSRGAVIVPPPKLEHLILTEDSSIDAWVTLRIPMHVYSLPSLRSLSCQTWRCLGAFVNRLHPTGHAYDAAAHHGIEKTWGQLMSLQICRPDNDDATAGPACLESPWLLKLESLSLTGLFCVDDVMASKIASNLKHLRTLDLSGTRVTGVGVKALISSLPDLKSLNISQCERVGSDAVAWAQSQGLQVTCNMAQVGSSGRTLRYM